MEVENKLRELLLPVFGLNSIDEIKPEYSLVNDLDADSLDFVEIMHLIEVKFGVVISQNDILIGGKNIETDNLFEDGILTPEGESLLKENFPERKNSLKSGMTKVDLFSLITVRDFAKIIEEKLKTSKSVKSRKTM
ncbi:MAG: hypothetical protein JSV46_05885 [Candidatus Aminicenantes bacterium]|nr:MAG: hypothetical protein JSV46_05885 [Candidatus Aminicenantes bacterium]